MKPTSQTVKELDEIKDIENIKKIEAALFLSARYLSIKELVLLTDVNPLMLKELMEKLIQKYDKDDSAIEIISKENLWKMDVGQEYVHMVNKLATGSSEFSKAEQETLAIIAYKQPVKQSIIIKIRGNKAYEHIKNFTEIGLVHAKKIGHTKELRLSNEFFDYFHLQNSDKGAILNDPDKSETNEDLSDLQNSQGILNDHVESESSEDSTDLQNSDKGIRGLENNNIEKEENSPEDMNNQKPEESSIKEN